MVVLGWWGDLRGCALDRPGHSVVMAGLVPAIPMSRVLPLSHRVMAAGVAAIHVLSAQIEKDAKRLGKQSLGEGFMKI